MWVVVGRLGFDTSRKLFQREVSYSTQDCHVRGPSSSRSKESTEVRFVFPACSFRYHLRQMVAMRQYQVVGRKAPTEKEPNPPVYRMKVFAPNEVTSVSKFWYLMHQMRKMKKTTGEILDIIEVNLALDSATFKRCALSRCVSKF